MDLRAFVRCLTENEQRELFLILKEKYGPAGLETVGAFFERLIKHDRLSQRLKTCYLNGREQQKTHPESSCLNKQVKEVVFNDLHTWKGMGRATWLEFAALRDYGS